jgi:hypothetical protein
VITSLECDVDPHDTITNMQSSVNLSYVLLSWVANG